MTERRRGRPHVLATAGALLTLACASGASSPRGSETLGRLPSHGRIPVGAASSATADGGALAAPVSGADRRFEAFARDIVELVNRDRRAAGVPELTPDPEAAAFARAEATRLVAEGFGHHAADGSKPYQRWARQGHTARLAENLFRLTARAGRAYMQFDPADAQAQLMRSPGHRRNVLDPMHTGAGVAVAFDPTRNSVYVVQEFVDRQAAVEPGPRTWRAGETQELAGRLDPTSGLEPWMAVLYREPAPGTAALSRETRRRSYTEGSDDPAVVVPRGAFGLDGASGEFRVRLRVPPGAPPGPYTLMLYVAPRERIAAAGKARRLSTDLGLPVALVAYEVVR
ncbi:MAG TPA: CAP domain-containing protein [Gemmatimonadota bacterium]|jgi:uncharacterized protein YkwD